MAVLVSLVPCDNIMTTIAQEKQGKWWPDVTNFSVIHKCVNYHCLLPENKHSHRRNGLVWIQTLKYVLIIFVNRSSIFDIPLTILLAESVF